MKIRHTPEVPWGSFADALSGMLFVFLLTTFYFAWQLAQATEAAEREKDDAKEKIETIQKARTLAIDLTREGNDRKWTITRCLTEKGGVIPKPSPNEPRIFLYLPGVEWFDSGKASLEDKENKRIRAADELRVCIEELIKQEPLKDYKIRVYLEGHTDSQPIPGDRETNWELSGRRSAVVVRHVLDGSAPSILSALEADTLEVMAVGMADLRPAWQRLCEDPGPLDQQMCKMLEDGAEITPEVRKWANREDDEGEDAKKRRGLLRRVDLRLELLPRVEELPKDSP